MGGREGEGHHTAPLGPSEQLQLLGSPAGRLQSQPRSPSPGRPRGSPRTVCLTGAQGRDLSLSPPVPCLTGTPQGPQPGARGALVASRSKRTRRAAAARQDLLVRPHLVTGRTWARAPAAAHAAAVTGPAPPTPVPACLLPCAKPRLTPRRTRPLTRLGSFSCISGVCSHQVTGVTSQEARVTPEQASAHRPLPPSPHPPVCGLAVGAVPVNGTPPAAAIAAPARRGVCRVHAVGGAATPFSAPSNARLWTHLHPSVDPGRLDSGPL